MPPVISLGIPVSAPIMHGNLACHLSGMQVGASRSGSSQVSCACLHHAPPPSSMAPLIPLTPISLSRCPRRGGDLFHENKPSRSTLVKAIQIINRHCLGDQPVSFQILSDQNANFVGGVANHLDPNLNVGLPIFTIHGNHDDPTGADNLSAVDVLSSCRLVNYFGKHLLAGSNIGKVTLSPILIQKV